MLKVIKCTSGKPGHATMADAALFIRRRMARGGPERSMYKCKFCPEWHTSSRDLSGERRNVDGTVIKFSDAARYTA